jgi:hypothetical protein
MAQVVVDKRGRGQDGRMPSVAVDASLPGGADLHGSLHVIERSFRALFVEGLETQLASLLERVRLLVGAPCERNTVVEVALCPRVLE